MKSYKLALSAFLIFLASALIGSSAFAADPATYIFTKGEFKSCGPDIPGCETTVLMGDPATGAFQIMYRMKKGFEFVKHWHAASESLVMVKGTVILNTDGGKEQTLKSGDYVHIPANLVHWGVCPEECVFYIYVDGANTFNVVEK